MEYIITITETLEKSFVVEANSLYEAKNKVKKAYSDERIILDYRDYNGCEIECKLIADEWTLNHYPKLEDE